MKKLHILLIEDNPDVAEFIQEMLTAIDMFPFRLTHTPSLAQGVRYLNGNASVDDFVDVVLLDLNLPDSSGFGTFDRLSEKASTAPVILMTSHDNEELALEAVRKGAQDYLLKTDLDGKLLTRSIQYAIERKRIQEALRVSEERYTLAIQGANDGLWDWDLNNDTIYFSPRWKRMLGYQEHEIGPCIDEWLVRIHQDDIDDVKVALHAHMHGGSDHFEAEYRIERKDGTYMWALTRGLAVRGANESAYRMAGSQTDITLRKRTEEQLIYDAFHDSLTGLPNRALLLDRMSRLLDHTKRNPKYRFAVLLLDLDRFKVINESYGHLIGDQALIAVSNILESSLRSGDSVARLGGDEFVMLLESVYKVPDAVIIAERILETLNTPLIVSGESIMVTASIGIVIADFSYDQSDDILRDADIAMYQAKSNGKDCYTIFNIQMRNKAMARMGLENDLRLLLGNEERINDQFELLFQPIVRSINSQIAGFEALLRWHHPHRGLILPNEFIPIAEETGLIHQLGMWVLRRACQQVSEWQTWFPKDPDFTPVCINVNISGKQFLKGDLVEQIEQVLQEYSVPPDSINLEITEGWLMEHRQEFFDQLEGIRKLGINLQIDDFGRGYSSYSYLQYFPIDTLKIDSAFIQRLGAKGNNVEIVRSIVQMASSMGMSVVAEGVETEVQFEKLKKLGCPYVQGFYFSIPLNGEQAGELLVQNWKPQLN
ncbi:putative bifunctional diguanylate cyclase/phosphodiesterase [Chloroflexota bacterium]